MINYFDTSDYPNTNPYNILHVNKRVLGKIKDELKRKIMKEFAGLRFKITSETGQIKKAKRIRKCIVKN